MRCPSCGASASGDFIRAKGKLGCGAIVAIVVAAFIIIVGMSDCNGPSVKMSGGVAKLKKTYVYTVDIDSIGSDIALDVYNVAKNHTDATKIVVSVYLNPAMLTDEYGNEKHGDMFMGSITVSDLDDVRRYADEATYSSVAMVSFALQVRGMKYAEYFKK